MVACCHFGVDQRNHLDLKFPSHLPDGTSLPFPCCSRYSARTIYYNSTPCSLGPNYSPVLLDQIILLNSSKIILRLISLDNCPSQICFSVLLKHTKKIALTNLLGIISFHLASQKNEELPQDDHLPTSPTPSTVIVSYEFT